MENDQSKAFEAVHDMSARRRSVAACAAGILLAFLTACPGSSKNVPCTQDSDCDLSTGGTCIGADSGKRWCAYPDPACSSGLRFSEESVGDGLAGTCVPGTRYTLTVTKGGSGEGAVSANPDALTCSGNTCTGQFNEGTVVELSATPTVGQFLGWSNPCVGNGACVVTMDRDQTVGALFGMPGTALWAKHLAASGSDEGHGVAIDSNGDVVAVGEFTNTLAIGSTMLTSAGLPDVFVVKLSGTTGDVIWAKRFGGTEADRAFDVAVDSANNIYVTGQFFGTVDFGGGNRQSGEATDTFVLKLDGDGTRVWDRDLNSGTTGFIAGRGIAVRGAAVVVVGYLLNSVTVNTTALASAGEADIFAVSLSGTDGTTTWAKRFGGTAYDLASDVVVDGADNVLLVGEFRGTVNFGGSNLVSPNNRSDILLLKLAGGDGSHLLSKNAGGDANDSAAGIAVDPTNNIFIVGSFGSTASFGCSNTVTASKATFNDAFLAKYSPAGSCTFVKSFAGTGDATTFAAAVATNASGDVAISGRFHGSVAVGAPVTLNSAGGGDVFAARFAADGTHLSSARLGGAGTEFPAGIAQNANGQFYVTGGFEGLADFGGNEFTSAGMVDGFVVALEAL